MPLKKKKVLKRQKKVVSKRKKTVSKKRILKGNFHQTGNSVSFYDKKRKAKAPGKRKSKSGNVYYERRKNRSDKPGSLSGVAGFLKTVSKTIAFVKKANRDKKGYILNDVLYVGGVSLPFAPKSFLKDAGIKFAKTSEDNLGYIVTLSDLRKFVSYLLKKDGVITY